MGSPAPATLTIICRTPWFISGAPLYGEVDGRPAFLAWDHPVTFRLPPGAHGVDIWHTPPGSLPLGGKANRLSKAVELQSGFGYVLAYTARMAPMLPPKVTLTTDRMK